MPLIHSLSYVLTALLFVVLASSGLIWLRVRGSRALPARQRILQRVSVLLLALSLLCCAAQLAYTLDKPAEVFRFIPILPLTDKERVSWITAKSLLSRGMVDYGVQRHSGRLNLYLKNGKSVSTVQPNLDAVYYFLEELPTDVRCRIGSE